MNQLRLRSMYSFGECFAPLDRMIARLKAIGATAAGIVDLSGTWGHVPWAEACGEAGIAPLFGFQAAVVEALEQEERSAMWFLALSTEGLRSLYHFSSLAQRQAARGTPRLLREDVQRMKRDEIASFAGQILDGPFLKRCHAYIDFDPASERLNALKAKIAKEQKLRTVCVSDNAYSSMEDRATFDMIGRTQRVTPQHILDRSEMVAVLGEQLVIAGEKGIAELVKRAAGVKLPYAPLITVEGDLEALAREGIKERRMTWTEEYEARLVRELAMINEKGFPSYFLMVADMVRYAKQHMLVGPSRGSAAGSLVCYLTRITEIDPIPTGLIFERFIDVTRKDLPDIDLDFPDSKRGMVIQYLRDKYGAANVSHIGTVSTFQPKSALIAVAKRLGVPVWETSAVKDSIFDRSSGDSRANFALLDTLEQTEPGKKLLEKYPAMSHAAQIEAHAVHSGIHAAGILVCNDAIENYCTVTADGVAQIDKPSAETLNLLKIDILGLRTLGVLEDSGIEVDWYGMEFNDPATFDVLNHHRYAGIFQFEGQSLQSVSGQMTISSIDDIGHVTALARPGPMASGGTTRYLLRRAGKEAFRTPHPAMDKYVKDTYGTVVYQEQVLRICREIGKLNWEDTTSVRKVMSGRKGIEFFNKFRDTFLKGAAEEGVNEVAASEIWNNICTHGSWSFNLAHSYSYAVVSYWTAWLKAHHLLEFAAATLRNVKDESSAIKLLRELISEGVNYTPFDPERSQADWSVKDGELIGGFKGLKGIGESKANKLVALRAAHGGKLPEKECAEVLAAEQTYADVFPTERRWGHFYSDPEANGIRKGTRVVRIEEIAGEAEFVYIGRLIGKDLRDHNELIRVKRREGKMYHGPTLFLDLDIEDDTGKVLTRIERYDFERLGRPIWESAQVGTWWLIRGERRLWGRPDGGFRMIYVKNIKQLSDQVDTFGLVAHRGRAPTDEPT